MNPDFKLRFGARDCKLIWHVTPFINCRSNPPTPAQITVKMARLSQILG